MFVGRDRELATLERRWNSSQFECVIVHGRRRVGKTTLINHFLKGRPAIFFPAIESNMDGNLKTLSNSIAMYRSMVDNAGTVTDDFVDTVASAPVYQDFESALESIFQLARSRRLVLVIDEYPYLAKADRSISSVLQHAIDRHKDDSKLMIILCGSSMSFMERQVLGYTSPLYGRRTAQIKVEPFGYTDVRKFLPRYTAEDAAIAYGLTDGIPQYLRQIDDTMSIRNNVRWNIIDPDCYLFEEPGNLLKQELRSPAEYNSIIQAIASGASRLNTIASSCHMETSSCSTYLRNLIDLGIVHKETPFGEDSPRKTIYRIEDSFFRFWYRFVPANMPLIRSGNGDIAVERIMQSMNDFMGMVFEDMCIQWLWANNASGKLPFLLLDAGRWWGADPKTHSQEEIDIVATGDEPKSMLFCECKWRSVPSSLRQLETLRYRSSLLHAEHGHFMLFSKTGFDDHVIERAKLDDDVTLIDFADM
ncbi:ATP-binding protein [Bifidobacterium imperatoris]|uniref:ATP-binding protein n=1 Tax=Bifidobacterium imperatoris TaxID=2020965 RepID=A0A2N5IRM7_9BIFI|nr:ATP-binding protein [Bifidobacterium imperatoris]PLS24613.1 ATPase [Bifidobacterium imperatoris]QSY57408.1 ATP-binding protein [Bifidobacterium imperatoris]